MNACQDKSRGPVSEIAGGRSAPGLTLGANFVWAFGGNAIYATSQWLMLVVLAKLGTAYMVGQFALALAVTAPVFMFANLQLRAVQATDAGKEYSFREYLGLAMAAGGIGLAVVAVLGAAGGYPRESALIILMLGAAKSIEIISDILYGLLQQRERMDRVAICTVIRGLAALLVLAFGVWLTGRLAVAVSALCLIWMATLLFCDVSSVAPFLKAGRREAFWRVHTNAAVVLRPRWSKATLQLARRTLPLGVVAMLFSLNVNIPRYFVEHHLGERELGLFTPIAYLMVAGNTLVIALGQSAGPRLGSSYAEGDLSAFRALLGRLVGMCVPVGALGILVAALYGPQILRLLYRQEYAAHADVFVVLMVAAAISYTASILNCGMIAARHFKAQLMIGACTVAVSVLACWRLVPPRGMYGAGLAQVAASLFQAGATAAVVFFAVRTRRLRPACVLAAAISSPELPAVSLHPVQTKFS